MGLPDAYAGPAGATDLPGKPRVPAPHHGAGPAPVQPRPATPTVAGRPDRAIVRHWTHRPTAL